VSPLLCPQAIGKACLPFRDRISPPDEHCGRRRLPTALMRLQALAPEICGVLTQSRLDPDNPGYAKDVQRLRGPRSASPDSEESDTELPSRSQPPRHKVQIPG
jgi:hypothetical protein